MFLKGIVTSLVLVGMVQAATPADSFEQIEDMVVGPPGANEFQESNKAAKKTKRKLAATGTSAEFQKEILNPWLKVETSENVSDLLKTSYAKYAGYTAPDVKYFVSQLHTMIPLKAIVWRLRPLFETGFKGNRATHVTAVQMVRNITTALSAALPTKQTDALIKYFTVPGPEMNSKMQFQSVSEFQKFLVTVYVPYLKQSAERVKAIHKANPSAVYVWDNRMFFGTASFRDGFNQFLGHGPAERHIAMALAWESIHDAYVFSAYNQDELINVAGKLGRALGMDVFKDSSSDALGLTDKERVTIIKNVASERGFLDLKGEPDTKSAKQFKPGEGRELMKKAYDAKKWAVTNFDAAYKNLEGKSADPAMVINPALYQSNVQNRLNAGVKRMVDAIEQKKEFQDPVSNETVVLNVPEYYTNPPATLTSLMANGFETGDQDGDIKGMKYRNYLFNRSSQWNNNEWSKYIVMTDAQKQDPMFMMKAKRILHYSLGATPVFGAIDLFVR